MSMKVRDSTWAKKGTGFLDPGDQWAQSGERGGSDKGEYYAGDDVDRKR